MRQSLGGTAAVASSFSKTFFRSVCGYFNATEKSVSGFVFTPGVQLSYVPFRPHNIHALDMVSHGILVADADVPGLLEFFQQGNGVRVGGVLA
jgi:hypothetical protein